MIERDSKSGGNIETVDARCPEGKRGVEICGCVHGTTHVSADPSYPFEREWQERQRQPLDEDEGWKKFWKNRHV